MRRVDETLSSDGATTSPKAIVEDIARPRVGELRQIIATITPEGGKRQWRLGSAVALSSLAASQKIGPARPLICGGYRVHVETWLSQQAMQLCQTTDTSDSFGHPGPEDSCVP